MNLDQAKHHQAYRTKSTTPKVSRHSDYHPGQTDNKSRYAELL